MSALPPSNAAIWRWPLVLGVATAVGLLSALLGDAGWDALSWLGLGAPVVVAAWFGWRRSRSSTSPSPAARGRGYHE